MFYMCGEYRGGYVPLPSEAQRTMSLNDFYCAVATSTPDNNDLQSNVELLFCNIW